MNNVYFGGKSPDPYFSIRDGRLYRWSTSGEKWIHIPGTARLRALVDIGELPPHTKWYNRALYPLFCSFKSVRGEWLAGVLVVTACIVILSLLLLAGIAATTTLDMGQMYPAEIRFQVGDKCVATYVLSDLEKAGNPLRPMYTINISEAPDGGDSTSRTPSIGEVNSVQGRVLQHTCPDQPGYVEDSQ